MIIQVDPSLLQSNAHQIQGIGGKISSLVKDLMSVTEGAPSYDGQFGPKVAAIGNEANARGRTLSNALSSLGEKLNSKGIEFANVDNAVILGFDGATSGALGWLETSFASDEYNNLLGFLKKYLSLGNLANGNGTDLSLGGLFAMILGTGQMWSGWTFFGMERPSWWPGWLPWSSQSPEGIISPIADDKPVSPKTTFGDLNNETPPATPPAQPNPAPSATTTVTPPPSTAQANPVPTPPSTTNSYDVYYNVPTEAQGNLDQGHGCSATAVSMLTEYYHAQNGTYATATPAQLQAPFGNSGTNIAMSDMSGELSKLGYKASWTFNGDPPGKVVTLSDLQSALKNGPVAVITKVKLVGSSNGTGTIDGAGSYAHALVVKGFDQNNVVVNDPWSGKEIEIPDATFSQMWSGGSNAIFVVRPS